MRDRDRIGKLTRRRVWIVSRKGHDGLEITAVVERVGIQDNESDVPVEDIVIVEL